MNDLKKQAAPMAAGFPTPVRHMRSPYADTASTLRLEEQLLLEGRPGTLLMLWRSSPCVVIGRGQCAEEEADLLYAASRNIPILRRSTGGGAVYHDGGNVNFSIFTSAPAGGRAALRELAAPVLRALLQMGAPVHFGGRNDLLLDDGRKVCGTAARISAGRLLFHGCICFDVDLEVMDRVLTPSPEKLRRHGIASVKSRVANLAAYFPTLSSTQFMDQLEEEIRKAIRSHVGCLGGSPERSIQ